MPEDSETADAPSDGQPPENEGNRSLFADLLDRIEEQRSLQEARWRNSDEINEAGEDTPSEENDPLDRVRELIPEGLPPPIEPEFNFGRNKSPDNRRFYVGIVLGIVIALVLPGVVLATAGHVTDTVFAPEPSTYVGENDTLYLEADDAAYLSRVFRETTHEVAYCGLITHEERPRLAVWMANTVNAGPEQIKFITENCPDATREVLIHTHPNGVLQLSEQDKRTLQKRPEEYICVQGGPIDAESNSKAKNLACYKQLESTGDRSDITRIQVIIL